MKIQTTQNLILGKKVSSDTINLIVSRMSAPIKEALHRKAEDVEVSAPLMIRWGTARGNDTALTLNKAKAVALTSNKGKFRKFLQDNGVPTPKLVDLRCVTEEDFPLIVRPNFHQKGKDYLLFNSLNNLQSQGERLRRISRSTRLGDGLYASRVYPKTSEWRVHVAHGKVLAVQQKVQSSAGGPCGLPTSCWNHDNGYVFEIVEWKEYRKDIVDVAIKSFNLSGLDFCAIDILADSTDDRLPSAVVCEINTAPHVEGYVAERYAEYFTWLLTTREPRHFIIPDSTPARHYVLKHRELVELDYDFPFQTPQDSDGD